MDSFGGDLAVENDLDSQEKQRLLIACPYGEILYGGAAGGGKSSALLMDAMNHMVKG